MKKIVFLLLLSIFLISGCSVKKVQELTDSERFANEFSVSDKNPFVYAKYDDIEEVLNSNGIIFLATPDEEGSIKAANYIIKVATKNNVEKIYYYNYNKIKEKDKKKYNKLVTYFKEYLVEDEEGLLDLKTPILASIKDSNILGYSNYFSKEEQLSEEKLTNKKIKELKAEYEKILNYQKCSNCN